MLTHCSPPPPGHHIHTLHLTCRYFVHAVDLPCSPPPSPLSRYLIHTAGNSYSAGLKYKLACGSLVLKFRSPYSEFFEPGLLPGVHYVDLVDEKEKLETEAFPAIKAAVQEAEAGRWDEPPAMALKGKSFAMHQLTQASLSCYWLKALERYAEIYYM